MEKKRKLPARAAARAEAQVKKRNITPRQRSITPAPPPPPEEPVEEAPPPPPPLPKSVQPGEPLPVIDDPQADDLSAEDYQSVTESGVLAESLTRSRHKWIHEGLFEKYWSKPHKRKGVMQEDPKNPPKDSMTKVGHVTINIEPHIIEATMYVVKAPKPPPTQQQPLPQPQSTQPQQSPAAAHPHAVPPPPQAAPSRPILQYGPPNGVMPPPKSQSPAVASPSTAVAATPVAAAAQPQSAETKPVHTGTPTNPPAPRQALAKDTIVKAESPKPAPAIASPSPIVKATATPSLTPPAPTTTIVQPTRPVQTVATPAHMPAQPSRSGLSMPPGLSSGPPPMTGSSSGAGSGTTVARPAGVANPPAPQTAARPVTQAPKSSDPVIALLAQKASGDAELRELMKRVAVGQAKPGELSHFQQIIDQLNQEYKRSSGQQGPSADRLLVEGKTVKWFAGEVRTILDIVLASNPNQKSSELKPPPRSDPLVVMLVKTALEDQRTRDTIRRIAEDRPGPYDAQALKDTLDRLLQNARVATLQAPTVQQAKPAASNAQPHGQHKLPPQQQSNQANPQSLRSKGPPPAPKPDISAVVFDFGTGDRYLFPKYSILDTLTTPSGHQVVASFLIVRKGSTSEYGGDPKLDYYQPVTIRLQTQSGRQLENLTRVVAPVEEVRRYMDDIMDNMTRAEYVLLAMRLPRRLPEEEKPDSNAEAGKSKAAAPPRQQSIEPAAAPSRPAVLWASAAASKSSSGSPAQRPLRLTDPEEETESRYQRLIQAVTAKDALHV